ncbi:MAG: hypothetical protein LBH07_02920, partial [Treponema sp.]|nr:hypothetical protein [Treponema sp.]
PPELRTDLWLADWKGIAESTVKSGFRKTLVKTEKRTKVQIIIPFDGPWLGPSPFSQALFLEKDEEVTFLLPSRPEILACSKGILKLTASNSLWRPF